jgi:phospholipid/cholesterol/gamma-HCH transport system substrate-binding protein
VVLAGLALIMFGAIWLKGAGLGTEDFEIQARFREIGQLLDGNSVKLRGVQVGRVEEIALEETGAAVIVTMRIRDDVRLPEDPVVLLSPESMFGDWQAEIHPRRAFPQYEYAEAPDPKVLPGYSLPDISRLTAVADQIAQNMAILSDRFEIAFTDETAQNIREAIRNIQEVSAELTNLVGGQQRAVESVADNLRDATETLGEAAATIQRAFEQLEQAVGNDRLVTIVDNVSRTTARTDTLTQDLVEIGQEIRRAAANMDSTLRVVADVAGRLQRGQGTLGMLMADTMLYVRLRESSFELERLLRDIRENPSRYITIRIF